MTLKRPSILIMMLLVIGLLASIYIFDDHAENLDHTNVKEVSYQKTPSITISRDDTHIRSGPSTDHDIISFAKQDSVYTVVSESDDWYEVELTEKTGYIWKYFVHPFDIPYEAQTNILKHKWIILDAGHGGYDVGAIGANGNFEKDITLKTTKMLMETLHTLGANVLLTRADDDYIRLGSRTSFANMYDADVFISIHYNSFPEQKDITGIGTYYYNERSQSIAHHMQNAIVLETFTENRGVDFGNFQVLRETVNPAILVELGFISNSEQEKRLLTNEYQAVLIKGMIKGLTNYFQEQLKEENR